MKQEEIDTLWFKALDESIKQGELYTRYHFAALVAAAEREAIAKLFDREFWEYDYREIADAIRARRGDA